MPEKPRITWEEISDVRDGYAEGHGLGYRARVPGGWFVCLTSVPSGRSAADASTMSFFYPDPKHDWDGGSLSPTREVDRAIAMSKM